VALTRSVANDGVQIVRGNQANVAGDLILYAPPTSASTPLRVCPLCRDYPELCDSFQCKVCNRNFICKKHQNEEFDCCLECAQPHIEKKRLAAAAQKWWEELEQRARLLVTEKKLADKVREEQERQAWVEKWQREYFEKSKCIQQGRQAEIEKMFGHRASVEADAMVFIPAGQFVMGTENFLTGPNYGAPNEKPAHLVSVDSFFLSRYPVTNRQYERFLESTGHEKPYDWEEGQFSNPDQPVVNVSWYDAVAYCKWAGMRLPTEAEWEKAARGGLSQRIFPWGDEEPLGKAPFGVGFGGSTVAVGSFPPNDYGLVDMVGNAGQWCTDWYDENYYKNSPENNPTGPDDGKERVVRGGSWAYYGGWRYFFRCAFRFGANPSSRDSQIGLRCAKSL
jgi:iron(II)-dependent oxidoreductase